MTLAEAVLCLMWVGVTLYAVFGGADFGAGLWDLLAGGAHAGAAQRTLIERSLGPVWEANHVWLIFVLVVLWTGFPTAFAAVMATLYVPLTLAAVGVILRGSGFAFRKSVGALELKRVFGATFATSSVLTPFFLGAVAGAVASGRVPLDPDAANAFEPWVTPTSVLGGTLAVAVCAYLAAVFLAADAERGGDESLVAYFRRRAAVMAVITGAVATAGIVVLRVDAPELFDGLRGRGLPLVLASAVGGLASIRLVLAGRYRWARVAAVGAVVAVVWGWAAAQYPYLLEGTLTIEDGAGARATLVAMLVSLGIGAALFAPGLVWLLVSSERGILDAEPKSTDL